MQCRNEAEYATKALPGNAQLMVRMRRRGAIVDAGQRIEYVVIHPHIASPLADKLEDLEYFREHSDILRVDWNYYIRLLSNPVDQLCEVIFGAKMVAPIMKTCVAKHAVHQQLCQKLVVTRVGRAAATAATLL